MRILSLLFAVGLTLAVTAAPRPLSNQEIGLMLRSGYSSESILAEISTRRLLEPLDEPTKKSLLDFGASAPLMAALESNAYIVSAPEAVQARQLEAEIAARRAAQIEQDRERDTLYQAQRAEALARGTTEAAPAGLPVLEGLKSRLVRCQGGSVRRGDGSELEGKKFVALYYSAHWCAPCRKFTPQLVEYYKRVTAAHPELEIVFVSADRSRFGWETYIREMKMPWLAVDYDKLPEIASIQKLGGDGIPSLLVLDAGSHKIASSYDGDKYLGPQNAIAALDEIFAGKAGPKVAQAP